MIGKVLLTALLGLAVPCSIASAQSSAPEAGRRLATPSATGCDRNQLTSYHGVVTGYRRDAHQLSIEIHTDADTVEQTTLQHNGQEDVARRFLLWGAPFSAQDWNRIEQSPGVLRKDVRVIAWICEDGKTPPVLDWRPAQP